MLRVISGKCKGYKLVVPDPKISRPTRDMVRESIFSMIQFECENATVLDIFAGSGAMGTEALSRGAIHCDFVDNNISAVKIIKNNLNKIDLETNSQVYLSDYQKFLLTTNKKYDIIFLDPPYNDKLVDQLLKLVVQRDLVVKNGLIIYEFSGSCDINFNVESIFSLHKNKKYGKTNVIILKKI